MGEHFKSNIDSWLSVSKLLYYGGDTVMIEMEKLYDAYDAAQEAIEKVNNAQESIGSLVLTTTLSEIEEAIHTLRDNGCTDLTLLKCTSTYPATPENTNLLTIPH